MKIIENSKASKSYILGEFNNLGDKPSEFFRFITVLCNKYKMKIYKVAKHHSSDRNLGVQLLAIDGHSYIFYNYTKRILELELQGDFSEKIEKDILKYATTCKYEKNDVVLDEYGIVYILGESVEYSKKSKRIVGINKENGIKNNLYNCSIVPYIK